jgi:hypothetical protein
MRKLLIGVLLLAMTGCYSFGRGVASRVVETLDTERGETRQCEIRGGMFRGISAYLDKGETVKVLIVHGIGTHRSRPLGRYHRGHRALPRADGVLQPVRCGRPGPRDPAQRLANLRISRGRNPEASRQISCTS